MSTKTIDRLLSQIVGGAVRYSVNCFLTERKSRNFSPNTIKLYTVELGYFCTYLDSVGVINVAELTPDTIRQYLLQLAEHRNPAGCHCSYRIIKTFLRWVWDEFEIESRNPITRVEPPKINPQPLPGIALADIQRLIDACNTDQAQRDKTLFLFMLDTGCRASEVCAVNVDDIDLMSGAVIIQHGKGDKRRVVFMGKQTRQAVRRMLKGRRIIADHSPLWLTEQGERLARAGLREIIRRRSKNAGLAKEPGAHDFRRAFCLNMLRNGCDLVTLSRLMGHSGLELLKRYLAQNTDDLQNAHALNSPVDRM